MTTRTTLAAAAALTALATGSAGCSSTGETAARQAAERFYAAVAGGQGERACALLTPEAAESLRTGDGTCGQAVLALGLPGGEVTGAQVWGDEAQVRLARDTVFLHRFAQGWLVRGAGCRPRGDLPYDCEVEG
ncbi:hypothetical protein [Planomonospora venezuelensis]|uniref:Lipoprotein n=1 Tax=Planomonospora venezuelensis TaxID=1999 RepID=A0A841DC54_PLAVE|nr:hypothetical protein [Planomonospora venezuelensis]MBB5966357.1 hypothetical protein [Planomonospora venezuelensis]GIN02816.1 hypothetical protein Pve01_44740 [Planomonospora venezuelensis]